MSCNYQFNKLNGAEAFEAYYSLLFGDRWGGLKQALFKPVAHCARINSFCSIKPPHETLTESTQIPGLQGCFSGKYFPVSPVDETSLCFYYLMDPASVIPPGILDVKPGEQVLDMCAAPGGKTLILAEKLCDSGFLSANDLSRKRTGRLKEVVDSYLPESVKNRVKITSLDASKMCLHEQEKYDAILLDAPCSSERHVITDEAELNKWSSARIKNLAFRQYALISSAFRLLKNGGRMVYSTCAMTDAENDHIIEKLIKKHGRVIDVVIPEIPFGEKKKYGTICLPDTGNLGPAYMALFYKKPILKIVEEL